MADYGTRQECHHDHVQCVPKCRLPLAVLAGVSGHLPRSADTLVLLMAVANQSSIAQRLLDLGRPSATAVACIEQAATTQQRVTRCTLHELALPGSSPGIASPALIVIGPTVPLPSDG